MIPADDNQVVGDDRRGRRTIAAETQRHRQLMAPKFFSIQVVTDQTERAEITDYVLTIGCGSGCRRAAFTAVEHLEFLRLHAARPGQLAILPPIAASLEFVVGKRRQEKPISPDARR